MTGRMRLEATKHFSHIWYRQTIFIIPLPTRKLLLHSGIKADGR